ncbi:MAG: hypothetical protein IPM39_10875 [Chloroflexi bacterium]|nr:hypothetical protein [Chloroflexota bacterium]
MRKQNKSRTTPTQPCRIKSVAELKNQAVVNPHAAGLDIGSRETWTAASPHHDGETARYFATFTPDLEALADWLLSNRLRITSCFLDWTNLGDWSNLGHVISS